MSSTSDEARPQPITAPSVPPTTEQFRYQPPQPAPVWPKIIGLASIVIGGLAVPCGLCMAVSTLSADAILAWSSSIGAPGPPGAAGAGTLIPQTPMPPEIKPGVLSIAGLVLWPIGGLMLLVAGILLVQHRSAARPAHLIYAVLSVLGGIAAIVGGVMDESAASRFVAGNPDDSWAEFITMQRAGGGRLMSNILLHASGFVYPVFVAIWFTLVKKSVNGPGALPDRTDLG